ncbi:toxin-antitoxin system TumE family protein [Rhizobium wenxiniae]|uniref:toxin-antitoxin system TumE family protein n=1 Tax=Rhizobium wenxiniae TaxID=1737357 RepID=UPI003C1B2D45
MTKAKLIIKTRRTRPNGGFVELSVYEVPAPLRGSLHLYKYRLAFVVDGVCVMRYDNEAGKGDHKHIGENETAIVFVDLPTLIRDFLADVERIEQ